jgi:hypothetical protein
MPRRTAHAAASAQPEPAPAAGHNSALLSWSDDQLIAKNNELEDALKAAQRKLDEWAKPHKEQLKEIEQILFARLNERGADSTRTDSGTAYISTIMNTKVESQEMLFDHIAENWTDLSGQVQLNFAKDAVKTFMETNGGLVPPGMSISHFQRLNIRRS